VTSLLLRPLTPSGVDPSEIRRVTERVLAQPKYDAAEPSLAARILMWILGRIARLLDLLSVGDRGSIVGVVILALAVGVTIFITVRLVRRVRKDPGAASVAGIGGRSATDWWELARRAEAAHQWDEALRCSYRALLAELVAAGVTDEVAGRTARDYLRDISGAAPAVEEPLTWMTDAFEATWYDRRPVAASDLDAVRRASDDVRRGALVGR
jgi:hypothetical protein